MVHQAGGAQQDDTTGISGLDACYVDSTEAAPEQCTSAPQRRLWQPPCWSRRMQVLFITYLAQKESVYDLYLLEQLYYLTAFSPDGSETGTSAIPGTAAPVTQEVVGSITISFNAEQLAEAGFQVEQGDIYADAYLRAPRRTARRRQKAHRLTKRVDPVDGTMEPGSLVRIILTPDFSSLDGDIGRQLLVLDDYIPTGMRFEITAPIPTAGAGTSTAARDSGCSSPSTTRTTGKHCVFTPAAPRGRLCGGERLYQQQNRRGLGHISQKQRRHPARR